LTLPQSGTATRPIVVGTPTGGCTNKPVIDGSASLPASSWSLYKGNIYQATLASTPLQLTSEASAATSSAPASSPPNWSPAHHPNRGYLAVNPTSPYLTTAADSDISVIKGQQVSTTVISGGDLTLPAGASLIGAGVHIRTYSWWMDESTIAAVNGTRLTLAEPTWYPLGAGWGYYFTGKQWMVDSEGEWFHDAAAQRLYAYMPGGKPPGATVRATVLAVGIDLKDRSYVTVENIVVRRVGTGVDMRASTASVARNSSFEDIHNFGADVTASFNALVEANAFTRIGLDAISGWRHNVGWSMDLVARNNVIRDAGVLMNGEEVLSQPRLAMAAILGGERSTISGNTILNAGYIGILVRKSSVIEKNFVYGACTVLDDCAGIYIQYANDNAIVRGNTVVHTRGALLGKPASWAYTQGQGIYLDESASGVLVEDNTVMDADNGILLHVASNNTVRNNRLYGNRLSQIWMQATRNTENPAGDVYGNRILGNLIAPVAPGSVGIFLQTVFASTSSFGTIDGNRYLDRTSPTAVLRSSSAGTLAYTFTDWQSARASDLPAGRDASGSATSVTRYAGYRVAGPSLVSNGALASNAAGWSTWNQTAPLGQIVREACPAGSCLRYVGGGSVGLISAPNFSIVGGQWYRLSIDLATAQEGQIVNLKVRRGGGGNNGYEDLSDRNLSVAAGRSWKRYSMVFQGTLSVNAHDPVTGDLGARIDIEPVEASKTLSLANVELVPITPEAAAQVSGTFVNAGAAVRSWTCPFASSQPSLCSKFRRLADDAPVVWPMNVAAQSAEILYAQEPTLLDSDGDGIADVQDSCPATPAGVAVNAGGCPLTLR
jgi:parallel beta-helix repeat protein